MGERHTDTQYKRVQVFNTATQVLVMANRKRRVHLNIGTLAPPIFISETPDVTAGTGRLVNRWKGLDYDLGPGELLYAVTVGPFGSVLFVTVTDKQDEGQFTDDGSGIEGALGGGGDSEKDPPTAPRPGSERTARG